MTETFRHSEPYSTVLHASPGADSDTTFAPVEERSTRVTRCAFEAESGLYAYDSR